MVVLTTLFRLNSISYGTPTVQVPSPLRYLGTGKNDLTRRVTHREAASGSVIHSIFDACHYEVLRTCRSTTIL